MRNFKRYIVSKTHDDEASVLGICDAIRMRCADLSKNYFAKITYGTYTLLALMPPNAFFEYVRGEVRTKYVEETPFRVYDGRAATLQTASSLWRISYENGRIVVKNEELNIQVKK